jgi:hypothetical protein
MNIPAGKRHYRGVFCLSFVLCLLIRPADSHHAEVSKTEKTGKPLSNSSIIWDIGSLDRFDPGNKDYPLTDGVASVDLAGEKDKCPTGLGHLASGRPPVKEIRLRFQMPQSGTFWLHVDWNPGGSGKEQFEVLANGVNQGKSSLIDAGEKPNQFLGERFPLKLEKGENTIAIRHLSGDGLNFKNIILSTTEELPALPPANRPDLKYPTLSAYEAAIKAPGILLEDPCVRLFAPKNKAKEAKIIHTYLVKAYEELYKLVGVHTEYKIVVYHFPEGHADASGGTSNCVIWYSDKNLDLNAADEWRRHHVPHLSGYVEEMAHNFVHATHAQFGWEMIGWSLGASVTEKVAGNPIHRKQITDTRKEQAETFRRYKQAGFLFPADLAPNLCDRIHAYILWTCEQKYGPAFWPDFFREIRGQDKSLIAAVELGDADKIRNKRYQITIECFDRLKGLDFKKMLQDLRISFTTDVKSLHPTEPGWNQKFIAKDEATAQ